MALSNKRRALAVRILEQATAAGTFGWAWDDELCDRMEHGGPPLNVTGERWAGPGSDLFRREARRMTLQHPTWLTAAEIEKRHATIAPGAIPVEVVVRGHSTNLCNVGQVKGLPDALLRWYWEIHPVDPDPRNADFDRFVTTLDVEIRHSVDKPEEGERAAYLPAERAIRLPPFEMFFSAPDYYLTPAHEPVHWADHSTEMLSSRPTRAMAIRAWRELAAEFGAVFVCDEMAVEGSQLAASPIACIGYWRDRGKLSDTEALAAAAAADTLATWISRIAPGWRATEGEPIWRKPPDDERFRSTRQPTDTPAGIPRTTSLVAAARARALVASAEALGRMDPGTDPDTWNRQAMRLLETARQIDLANPAVEAAIEAAVALETPADATPITAASWLRTFQERTMRRRATLQLTRTAKKRAKTASPLRSITS